MTARSSPSRQASDHAITEPRPQRRVRHDLQGYFRSVFNTNVIGAMVVAVDGEITQANEYLLELIAYQRADLPLPWDAITPPEWQGLTATNVEETAAIRGSRTWEMQFIRRGGIRVPVSVDVPRPLGIESVCLCLVRDLTEIRQAQCRAREIDQRFRSLMEAGQSVVVGLSSDRRILEFNRSAERLYGRERASVLGQDYVRDFVPEDDREAVTTTLRRVLGGQPNGRFENSIRAVDGTERVMSWSVSRVLDTAGQTGGVIAVGQDITERKRTDEAMLRYEQIVRASSDLLALVDSRYAYLAVNDAYTEAFGKTPHEIVGQRVADLVGEEVFRAQVKTKLDRCLAGERVHYQLSLNLPRLGRRFLDVQLSPFRDSGGSVAGVVAASRDVTEQQQAEDMLIEQQRRLRRLASELALAGHRERQRVAVGLHDDVGQALAMAKLKLGSALQSALSNDVRRLLEETRKLLDQSIAAVRSLTFQLSSVVLRELGLEAALQQLVEWFDTENHNTRFVFASDAQAKPLDDDQGLMLYEIARELLFNAVKYAQALHVRLTIERAGDRLRILIEDDGVGFDTACLEDGLTPNGGFGYFSIRERLTYLGGELEVESIPGRGTRVVAVAPLQIA